MLKSVIIFISLFSFSTLFAQEAKVVKFPELQNLINTKAGRIQILNFWATWCGPCVKELPYFESVGSKMKEDLEINLISVDFVEELEKVNKFIVRKDLKSTVYLIDDIDYNSWIDKVETQWSGAIPATLIVNPTNGKRIFVEHELKEGELEKMISEIK